MKARPAFCFQALGLLLLLATAGCVSFRGGELVTGKPYKPTNIYGSEHPLPLDVRRVAVLPLNINRSDLEAGQTLLQPVLEEELSRTKRFEVVPVSPEQLAAWTGRKSLWTAEVLPKDLLVILQEKLGCDAVLFAELTHFQAYPPLAVGWNLKLVEVRSGQLLWAADEVFDAGHPAVAAGARLYHSSHSLVSGPLADSRLILLSPTAFGRYSAQTLFAALPEPTSGLKFSTH